MDERFAPTKLRWRFGFFLGCHLFVDLLSLVPLVAFLVILGYTPADDPAFAWYYLPNLLSMAVYFPLGMLMAKGAQWTVPSWRHSLLTIVLPAALWLFLFIWVIFTAGTVSTGSPVFIPVFLLTAPQTAFCLATQLILQRVHMESLFLLLALLPALLLPSLLFTLGSAWQSRRQANSSH